MSPTEFELRAALRDGEGGNVDPDRVVARAEAHRRQRRSRILSGASVVAVVAAIGIGGTALWQSGGSGGNGGGSAADSAAAGRNADSGGGAGALASGASIVPGNGKATSSVLTICEEHVPHLTGTSAQKTAMPGPIFDSSVTSISICSYGVTLDQAKTITPKGTTVSGKQAAELVDSLNSARTAPPGICPQYRTQDTQHYVLLGMDAKGKFGTPVVITLAGNPCQTTVTNGKAIRYEWSPPADIARVLASISPKVGGVPAPGHS